MSDDSAAAPSAPTPPVLRIVHGSPSDLDVAVLTAVMVAAGSDAAPRPRARRGGWNDPGFTHRRPLVPGHNAWRAAFLP